MTLRNEIVKNSKLLHLLCSASQILINIFKLTSFEPVVGSLLRVSVSLKPDFSESPSKDTYIIEQEEPQDLFSFNLKVIMKLFHLVSFNQGNGLQRK